MIRCPYCQVDIATRTNVCPLCHKSLTEAGVTIEEIKKTPLDFPKKAKLTWLAGSLFDKVYLLVALNLAVVLIIAELLVMGKIYFSWFILSLVAYFYVFLRVTLRHDNFFPQKVVGQAIILSIVALSTKRILPEPQIIFELMLPIIYLVSLIIIGIFFIINYKNPSRYLLNVITIALLGLLPFTLDMIEDASAHPLAIITASLAGVTLVTLVIFYARVILSELKRNFHV
ncbi:MAG: hypothetical protein J6V83_04695 [Clostridia bacterium]|nr:hypothetical protein [Clostridia bacterium]MBO7156683.1 hypothetical protein [Clostridia bacterium]